MQTPGFVARAPGAAALALSCLLAACAGNAQDRGESDTQENAVQGGTSDTSAAHNFAVGVANRSGGVCSGTLIAPNLILTARHCVVPPTESEAVTCSDTFEPNVAASSILVTTEPNLFRAKNYYSAREIITPSETAFCGNDIALIILAKNIPASEAQPAIPVVQFKMTDARLGPSITAMGYGITNPSANDAGQRRVRGNIPVICIPGSASMDCTGDNARFSDDPAEFVTEGYVCSGDSGSGAFDQLSFEKGTPYVLGALSRGPQTADRCLAAVYSRTDAHAPLIVDAAVRAAASGGYAAPEWTVPAAASPAPPDTCTGDVCTDTSATDPDPTSAGTKVTTTSTGCSVAVARGRFGTNGMGGTSGVALVGLALAGAFAARRRRAG